jgi:GNAT superfamily N-acetyltransferase
MQTEAVVLLDDDRCQELDAFLVERIYEFNSNATGYFDGRLLGATVQNDSGEVIAGCSGHTWGGCAEISHLWVSEQHRGRGLGKTLLHAAEAEATRRGCTQVVLTTHSFQAPGFYRRLGYERKYAIEGRPKGHSNIVFVKLLEGEDGDVTLPASGYFPPPLTPNVDRYPTPLRTAMSSHLRIARPVSDLVKSAAMYCRGVGLHVLGCFENHHGFDGVMLGVKGCSYHFEFTHCRTQPVAPKPTPEDLVVLYIPTAAKWQAACACMLAAGFRQVPSFNPYWEARGRTFEDLDGYRVVLQQAEWNTS